MLIKQLQFVGMQSWHSRPEEFADCHVHVRALFFGSGQGPDEKSANALIEQDCKEDFFTWIIRSYCLRHILDLIVKR